MQMLSNPCNGDSHCPDMQKCMETLQLILDGENTQYSKEELSKKLENCMPCFNHFQLAKCLKESLQEKLHQKEVPLELIDKIRMEIKTLA